MAYLALWSMGISRVETKYVKYCGYWDTLYGTFTVTTPIINIGMTTTPKSMNSYETKQSTSRCHQGVNLTDVTANARKHSRPRGI